VKRRGKGGYTYKFYKGKEGVRGKKESARKKIKIFQKSRQNELTNASGCYIIVAFNAVVAELADAQD